MALAETLTDADLTALQAQAILLNRQGVVVRANRSPGSEMLPSSLWRSAEPGADYLEACDQAAERGEPGARELAAAVRGALKERKGRFAVEYRVDTPAGPRRCLCQGAAVVRDGEWHVATLHLDITGAEAAPDSRERLSQLAHADRLATMGQFAAGVVHELTQPLSAISLYADSLRSAGSGELDDSTIREGAARIAESAKLARRIVERLRAFMTRGPMATSLVDVRVCVGEALTLAQFELQRSQTRCTTQAPIQPLWVRGDAVLLTQVVLNLLRNAIDASSDLPVDDREIKVSARFLKDGSVIVAVEDHGVGVSAGARDRLFEPFFTTKAEGMGVGLALCRSIAEFYGGDIDFRAGETGRGSTFFLKLPNARGAGS